MLETELRINQFLMQYAQSLVADLDDERLAEQPTPGVNHPAWILGHLAFSGHRARMILGAKMELPQGWMSLFGPESKLTSTRGDYPTKVDLLAILEQSFTQLRDQIANSPPELFSQPSANPYTRDALPTLYDSVAFLLTGHFGLHLGQLSAWRRMIGRPPLF